LELLSFGFSVAGAKEEENNPTPDENERVPFLCNEYSCRIKSMSHLQL